MRSAEPRPGGRNRGNGCIPPGNEEPDTEREKEKSSGRKQRDKKRKRKNPGRKLLAKFRREQSRGMKKGPFVIDPYKVVAVAHGCFMTTAAAP
jgi:G:T-mismatch repair DNA endonuclease (very short patch repair protein)